MDNTCVCNLCCKDSEYNFGNNRKLLNCSNFEREVHRMMKNYIRLDNLCFDCFKKVGRMVFP